MPPSKQLGETYSKFKTKIKCLNLLVSPLPHLCARCLYCKGLRSLENCLEN